MVLRGWCFDESGSWCRSRPVGFLKERFNQQGAIENLGKFVAEMVGLLGDFCPLLAPSGVGMRGPVVIVILVFSVKNIGDSPA